jgi:hypothetical protein
MTPNEWSLKVFDEAFSASKLPGTFTKSSAERMQLAAKLFTSRTASTSVSNRSMTAGSNPDTCAIVWQTISLVCAALCPSVLAAA